MSDIQNGFMTDSEGNKSSRRLAAFIFPSILYAGGLVALIAGVILGAAQWPIIGGIAAIGAGVVLQLVLFGLINVENVAKIAADIKKPQ